MLSHVNVTDTVVCQH